MIEVTVTNDKEKIPPSYRKPTVVRQLEVATWKMIFEKIGEVDNLDLKKLSYDSVDKFLCSNQPVSTQFILALKAVTELGNHAGRNLIEQASVDVALALDTSDEESDGELVARVWMQSLNNVQYSDVLTRALFSFEFSRKTKNIKEYVGESGFLIDSIDSDQIESMVSGWCRENKKSEVVSTYLYKIDAIWYCNIIRGDPIKRVAVIAENRQEALSYQPAAYDHVRIDPETGRIGILTRSSVFLSVYREVFGEVLTGKSGFFSGENICTLKPLQIMREKLFENNLPHDLQRVRVVELRWQRGNNDNIIVKGKDCFQILHDLGAKLITGNLIETKLDFYFSGSFRPSRVSIKVPNRIEIPENKHELSITRYLDKIGIRGRFDDALDKIDFWSLNPWHYSESMWRQQIGEDFDILRKEKCFHNIDLETVRSPDYPDSSGVMGVEHIGNDTIIGISEEDHIGVRTLTTSDCEGYKLDLLKVAIQIGDKLSLQGDITEMKSGLFSIGHRSLSSLVDIQVYLVTEEPTKDTSEVIKQHSNGYQSVLIIPEGNTCDIRIPIVHSRITSGYFDDLIRKIVERLGVHQEVDPPLWLHHDLILDSKNNKAWFKGHEIQKLDVSTHPFKFAKKIVEANGESVAKEKLNEYLSPHNLDDGVARKAKSDFIKKIKNTFDAIGIAQPDEVSQIFRTVKGGYAIKCSARII